MMLRFILPNELLIPGPWAWLHPTVNWGVDGNGPKQPMGSPLSDPKLIGVDGSDPTPFLVPHLMGMCGIGLLSLVINATNFLGGDSSTNFVLSPESCSLPNVPIPLLLNP